MNDRITQVVNSPRAKGRAHRFSEIEVESPHALGQNIPAKEIRPSWLPISESSRQAATQIATGGVSLAKRITLEGAPAIVANYVQSPTQNRAEPLTEAEYRFLNAIDPQIFGNWSEEDLVSLAKNTRGKMSVVDVNRLGQYYINSAELLTIVASFSHTPPALRFRGKTHLMYEGLDFNMVETPTVFRFRRTLRSSKKRKVLIATRNDRRQKIIIEGKYLNDLDKLKQFAKMIPDEMFGFIGSIHFSDGKGFLEGHSAKASYQPVPFRHRVMYYPSSADRSAIELSKTFIHEMGHYFSFPASFNFFGRRWAYKRASAKDDEENVLPKELSGLSAYAGKNYVEEVAECFVAFWYCRVHGFEDPPQFHNRFKLFRLWLADSRL